MAHWTLIATDATIVVHYTTTVVVIPPCSRRGAMVLTFISPAELGLADVFAAPTSLLHKRLLPLLPPGRCLC